MKLIEEGNHKVVVLGSNMGLMICLVFGSVFLYASLLSKDIEPRVLSLFFASMLILVGLSSRPKIVIDKTKNKLVLYRGIFKIREVNDLNAISSIELRGTLAGGNLATIMLAGTAATPPIYKAYGFRFLLKNNKFVETSVFARINILFEGNSDLDEKARAEEAMAIGSRLGVFLNVPFVDIFEQSLEENKAKARKQIKIILIVSAFIFLAIGIWLWWVVNKI